MNTQKETADLEREDKMKQRIITAFIGLALFSVCLMFFESIVFNIVIAAIAVIGIIELLSAAKITAFKPICVLCAVLVGATPFLSTPMMVEYRMAVYLVFVFVAFMMLLANHNQLRFADLAFALFSSFLLGLVFSVFIYIRDTDIARSIKFFYILLIFGGAWLADSAAYFAGRFFGKHKLAPVISPKKTIEGAVGGVLGCILGFVLLGLVFDAIAASNDMTFRVNYFVLIPVALVLSVVGMLGDLTFSVIKRQYGIKDYGNLLPGHGGVLDRFDSVIFTAPALYIIIQFIDIVG